MVKYTDWTQNDYVLMHGLISVKDIPKAIKRYNAEALRTLRKTDAEHIVYAVKYYGDNGNIERVHFHMTPLDDKTFHERTKNIKNAIVYAVHKH